MAKRKTQSDLRAEYATWTTQPDRCAICWIPGSRVGYLRLGCDFELAHIITRARGGCNGNVVGNVLFLCTSCHGAQHQGGYTYDGVTWPDIMTRHLYRAKLELGELSVHEIAKISGYTARYILDLTRVSWPEQITAERMRWGGVV